MTTFASWEEVGRWYAGLEKERRQPTAEIRKKAAELTADKHPDIAKIEALYDFVATNFRYVSLSFGVGRYQPHAAGDILHNQYGDCKDKHTLLASLLEASGYHASSVLINANRKIDPDVPSPSQFDHVISLVPLGQDEIWADTTTEVAPFRLLAPPLRKKQALVIPAGGIPHLEETPADPPMANRQFEEIEGVINDRGSLDAHVKMTVQGDVELLMRMLFRRLPQTSWQEFVKSMSALGGIQGEVKDLKVGDPAATKEAFHMEYQISANDFLDWAKKKSDLRLPMSNITMVDADEDSEDKTEFGSLMEYVYRLHLQLPAKYTARVPLPFSMKRDYAQYEAKYNLEGTAVTAERNLAINVRELPAERTGDYVAFRRAVMADLAQELSLENRVHGEIAPPPDLKADELNAAGKAAMDAGNYSTAVTLLKRAVEADPKHKGAWNNLGNAYLAQGKSDEAITAYKKQIEINPYDEYSYNNLGRAYWRKRDYAQGEAAFRKQIEVNPLDKWAHGNLGQMYSEWHKYEEAAPELERALSVTPNNALLHTYLGDAYLNLGQDGKAMASFDRALNISATHLVWNNIAYQLSLKKVHLDRAQQYAESAVSATLASSRNFTRDQLNRRDLGVVASLAAYWDTLGWVYLAQGNLEKAEKYVDASWALDAHGEVGDHLGQIYEKSGRREDAIRTYAMALSAARVTPEVRAHLAALVGDGNVESVTASHRDDLLAARTIKLEKVPTLTGSAEFFLLLANNGSGSTVEGVTFVNGDEKLKDLSDLLRTAKYPARFPDSAPAKVLRRGVLSCSTATKECRFVLMLPEDVHSVE